MADNRTTVDRFIRAMNERDLVALDSVFTEDVVLDWPQSNERIVGNENRREIYSRFPTLPTIADPRLSLEGDLVILEADLDYGDGNSYRAVFIFRMRDGLIAHETAYWNEPFPSAEWRAPWVEQLRS